MTASSTALRLHKAARPTSSPSPPPSARSCAGHCHLHRGRRAGLHRPELYRHSAPAKTPPAPIIAQLQKAIDASLKEGSPAATRLVSLGAEVATPEQQTSAGFAAFIKTDYRGHRPSRQARGDRAEVSDGLPRGACDCHCHVFGPAARFPYAEPPRSYTPDDAPFEAYIAHLDRLGCERGVLARLWPRQSRDARCAGARTEAPARRRGRRRRTDAGCSRGGTPMACAACAPMNSAATASPITRTAWA